MSEKWISMGGPLASPKSWKIYISWDFTIADLEHVQRHLQLTIDGLKEDEEPISVSDTLGEDK